MWAKTKDPNSVMGGLPYEINNRLRYSRDPDLSLYEFSTRDHVRRVRHLLPSVKGIGPKKLAVIDEWLAESPIPVEGMARTPWPRRRATPATAP